MQRKTIKIALVAALLVGGTTQSYGWKVWDQIRDMWGNVTYNYQIDTRDMSPKGYQAPGVTHTQLAYGPGTFLCDFNFVRKPLNAPSYPGIYFIDAFRCEVAPPGVELKAAAAKMQRYMQECFGPHCAVPAASSSDDNPPPYPG